MEAVDYGSDPYGDEPEPYVGQVVHYVSEGSPVRADGTQKYRPVCRAAMITEARDSGVALLVFNPTGVFFHQDAVHDEGPNEPGTWHYLVEQSY